MAVEFSTDTKRADALYRVWPEDMVILPELNGRHEHTSVEELAADMEKNGQDTPCVIRKDDEGRPVLVAGHRRYRAICLLNERHPEQKRAVICRSKTMSDIEAFRATIRENRFRKDVSPMDDCLNINILKERFGLADEDVAAIYFPEATDDEKSSALRFIRQRAALNELASEAAQAVRDGRVKITAAVALTKMTKTQQREKVSGTDAVRVADILKPAPIRAPKGVQKDAELMRRIWAVLEDVQGVLTPDNQNEYIEVERIAMVNLLEYVEELRKPKAKAA